MARLLYQKYQNNNREMTGAYGKWYGRIVHTETLNLRKLANHIASHGSIYTADVVLGVITKMRDCIVELVSDSKKVKLDGIGTFYLAAVTQGAETAEEFTADRNIKAVRLRFAADQSEETTNGDPLTGTVLARKLTITEDNHYERATVIIISSSSGSSSQQGGGTSGSVEEQP